MKKNKDVYLIRNNKIYGGVYVKKYKSDKTYCYINIPSLGEDILIKKNKVFKSLSRAEKVLAKRKISYDRYLYRKAKAKRIKNRILNLEENMLWCIKAQSRNEISKLEAEQIIQKSTEEIKKLKRNLS